MTVDDIIQAIRDRHGGAFWGVFHVVAGGGYKFLPTGHILTPAAYAAVRAEFAPAAEVHEPGPTAAQRKVNALRYKAENNHG
ncbi:hypothetical protein A3731_10335 [Roseovarius sp. HI0049]|nr:hypothetical protein A3731_10335 [Roseovarius sp. HI0049]